MLCYAGSMKEKLADRIRDHARTKYIEPSRRRGELTVTIVAGEVEKELGLQHLTPAVCSALKGRKFLERNHVTLEKWEGPPSGQSTTVKFTYRLGNRQSAAKPGESPVLRLLELWGIGKEVFESLGGGEAYLRSLREPFYAPGDPRNDW